MIAVMRSTRPSWVSELGWAPVYRFEQGLALTVDWYLQHQDWVRAVLQGRDRVEGLLTAV